MSARPVPHGHTLLPRQTGVASAASAAVRASDSEVEENWSAQWLQLYLHLAHSHAFRCAEESMSFDLHDFVLFKLHAMLAG